MQGLTLVHFLAQCKRYLWARGISEVLRGCLRRGWRGCLGFYEMCDCQKRLKLS